MRYRTRTSIWKYIKDPDAKGNNDDEDGEAEGPGSKKTNYENVVS